VVELEQVAKLAGQATHESVGVDTLKNPTLHPPIAGVDDNGHKSVLDAQAVQVDYPFKKFPVKQEVAMVADEHEAAPVPQATHVLVVTLFAVVV